MNLLSLEQLPQEWVTTMHVMPHINQELHQVPTSKVALTKLALQLRNWKDYKSNQSLSSSFTQFVAFGWKQTSSSNCFIFQTIHQVCTQQPFMVNILLSSITCWNLVELPPQYGDTFKSVETQTSPAYSLFSVFSVSVDWDYSGQAEMGEDRRVENITLWDLQGKGKGMRQEKNSLREELQITKGHKQQEIIKELSMRSSTVWKDDSCLFPGEQTGRSKSGGCKEASSKIPGECEMQS